MKTDLSYNRPLNKFRGTTRASRNRNNSYTSSLVCCRYIKLIICSQCKARCAACGPPVFWNALNVCCRIIVDKIFVCLSNKVFAFLGCYAALIGSYRRFGTVYRSHLQGLGSCRLYRNVGTYLPINVAYHPRRANTSVAPRLEPDCVRSSVNGKW
jgi:hypothetical protein